MADMHHQEQDARSLALHAAAIELMQADESLIQQALDILARWDTHVSARSKPLRDEWVRILRERDWALALSAGERGNQLRQASPVTCVLPTEQRLEIIQATSKHGLPMLKERQRKDAEEVAAGKRSIYSLLAVGKGDLDGATVTFNPKSEFAGPGWTERTSED
jgi:hypothetical protein